MDRGAWWATVSEVAENREQNGTEHTHTHTHTHSHIPSEVAVNMSSYLKSHFSNRRELPL